MGDDEVTVDFDEIEAEVQELAEDVGYGGEGPPVDGA